MDDCRVHHPTDILDRHVVEQLDRAGLHIDGDARAMRAVGEGSFRLLEHRARLQRRLPGFDAADFPREGEQFVQLDGGLAFLALSVDHAPAVHQPVGVQVQTPSCE